MVLPQTNRSGYCRAHFNSAKVCAVADCGAKIAAHNRNGYCREHYALGDGDARERWRDWIATEKKG